jgi:predicted dehydrogenase
MPNSSPPPPSPPPPLAALNPSRRAFIGGVASGAALLASGSTSAGADTPPPASRGTRRLRYALVGTGHRGTGMWGAAVHEAYDDIVEFVGLCDPNAKRAEAGRKLIGVDCPTFTSFEQMCDQARPELVGVTTVDAHHHEYIVKALDRGLRVLTEKPMVTDEKQCQAVLDAEKRSGRQITVGFNYRYAPRHERIKNILASGEIGKIVSVSFDWYLDTVHGADYFRRWHRLKANSGSLLVHKATHHFDLINWWLDADPVEVSAKGLLARYGKRGSIRHSHCRTCPHKASCDFRFDIGKSPRLVQLYVDAESVDGYLRDGCVFRNDIDIYDSMSAIVTYSNGAVMNYSLNAFMPYEGYSLLFVGEKGTLAVRLVERLPGGDQTEIVLTKNFSKTPPVVERPATAEGHGGGDERLKDLIFRGGTAPRHLALPGSRAGALSCLTGIAARKSIEEKRPIEIATLARI